MLADVVAGEGFPLLYETIRRGGHYTTAGAIGGPIVNLDVRTLYLNDLTMHGCTVLPPVVFANLVAYIERNEIHPIVAATFSLADMRAAAEPGAALPDASVEYASSGTRPGPPQGWIGDDAAIARYVSDRVARATSAIAAALTDAGVDHEIVGEECDNAAGAILAAAQERDVDVLCIGTHGMGRFEGLLGANSTKLARRAHCSVVLVRP